QGRPDGALDVIDQAQLRFLDSPINAQGYRSIPMERYVTERPVILLLGDSFTYGWSARPWFGAFADQLRAMGYVVHNLGITGTGPDQYARTAEVYVPQLKPDVVVVNFFMGNDIMYFPIESRPYEMVYYPTNAGVIMAYPARERLPDVATAYQFMLNEVTITGHSWLAQWGRTSCVGAVFWRGARFLGWLPYLVDLPNSPYFHRNQPYRSATPVSEQYLSAIRDICAANGSRFLCTVIPDLTDLNPDLARDYPGLFREIQPALAPMTRDDYDLEVRHFNLQGHRKYALWLDSLLRNPGPR
ncbi:MAG: SGNH/GDSL hydrolase family protein, partial [Lewinella sp.]|nr:SGNH/GDSL hydrolase family protein [Lewinella sp.]